MLKAWAIEMESSSQRQIFAVVAEDKATALAKAFKELEKRLTKNQQLKDFSVSLYTYVDVPKSTGSTLPTGGSSFAQEIAEKFAK